MKIRDHYNYIQYAVCLVFVNVHVWLSHLNSTLQPDNNGPHTAQASTIWRSSFAIIANCHHSLGHASCIHWVPKTAPHAHPPDASVWISWPGREQSKKLRPFQ